ncbi:hypothetical protein P8452_62990 [Trifolium repens]|nr:hypothetical protein P8452_62990 [Trifolium repens]
MFNHFQDPLLHNTTLLTTVSLPLKFHSTFSWCSGRCREELKNYFRCEEELSTFPSQLVLSPPKLIIRKMKKNK